MLIRFAGCTLDTDARRLFRGRREVHFSPKAYELLTLLVERRPRALSKAELLEHVWAGVFVTDASLARVINEIRRGLGDHARAAQVVRTVHGFGYAFDASVDAAAGGEPGVPPGDQAACWLRARGRDFALADGEHIVGRDAGLAVRLDSPKVSRRHARVVVCGTQATLEDLGSKNGTFIHGQRIAGRVPLKPGDAIRVGGFRMVFHVSTASVSTETEIQS
jgi:DNA-binding winged helix-turn-helix (wHTH) protein